MNLHQRTTLRRLVTPFAVATVLAAMLPAVFAQPALAAGPGLHVNFQPTGNVPSGYTADTGAAYNGTSGWTDESGNPIDLTGNTRIRNSASSPDARYDTFLIMQLLSISSGNQTPGRYVAALPNGMYDVTVGVGDANAINSVDEITAQPGTADATTIIDHYTPTTAAPWDTVTKRVNISNGQLILDPTGGTQTKIDYVDAVPATADTIPPVASVSVAGDLEGTSYVGAVTVTASATDNVGVTGISYTLDGGASQPYTTPFKVATTGTHTVVVTAVDAAGNPGSATASFIIGSLSPTSVHVNFQPVGTVPAGYTADTGVAYNGVSGWTDTAGNPIDMTANTRIRNSATSPDARYDTFLIMQALYTTSGNITPGRYVTALSNGMYNVTVGVGDATAINSVDEIVAQPGTADATTIIDHYTPTTAAPWDTVTKTVKVSNGELILDPTGGTQTKIDYVDAVPAGADTLPPTVSVSLSGTVDASSATTYDGPVQVTASATDNVGVTSTSYTIDGGASQPYTAPFLISTAGSHTVVVSAGDAAGNVGTKSVTFSISLSGPTGFHVNFAAQTSAAPAGYVNDYGVAYSAVSGSGWENASSGAPLSYVGNGRERDSALSPDKRYDTLMQMQETPSSSGQMTPGQWEHTLANGAYNVTVAVGDDTATNSVDTINAEPGTANAVVLINGFIPSSGNYFDTVTQRVVVSDGKLTLNATGGTNTKIDFVDVVAAGVDTTAPTASIALAGDLLSPNTYGGSVTATVTASDEAGGSGLATETYSLDGGPATPYVSPIKITALTSHTLVVTAKDNAGNVGTATATWTQQAASLPQLVVTSADQAVLGQAAARLVFSDVRGYTNATTRFFTFTNAGSAPLTVTGLKFAGTDATSFTLTTGEATSLTIAAGASAQVGIDYHPTEPTNCPNSASPDAIGDINRNADLVYTTNDPLLPNGSNYLSGVYACYSGGNSEPVVDQIIEGLGYTTIVDSPGADRRFLPKVRYTPGTDEVQSPYFVRADPNQPVTLASVAHYSGPSNKPNEPGGWYNQGAALASGGNCNSACNQLWIHPTDPSSTNLGQSERLMPVPTGSVNGVGSFNPTGAFGIYGGNPAGGGTTFTDDAINTSGTSPQVYEHNIRVYAAYDVNRVLIPNTYILAADPSRGLSGKNNDYNDIVMLLRNVTPAVAQGALPGAATTTDLTAGGTVSSKCVTTGFDGVLANTAGTQCNAVNESFSSAGLSLTSTAGVLTSNNQQNALYKSFDATRGQFTVDAQVVGPITSLTAGNQQIGAFFGPDQNNYVKVQADHTGTTENITMAYRENGTASTVATVAVPALSTASTLDLVIIGNSSTPDPASGTLNGWPLDELNVYYKINGGALVQVGTVEMPINVTGWFSRMAKAGILVSNAGTTTPIKATFSSFAITAP